MNTAEYQREYYLANRESILEYQRAHRKANKKKLTAKRLETPGNNLLIAARHRAKKNGLSFDIELSDVYIPTWCPILGIPLHLNEEKIGPDSPSLDKIVPELGYVKNNVQVISHRANAIKRDATLDELIKLGEWAKIQKERYETYSR